MFVKHKERERVRERERERERERASNKNKILILQLDSSYRFLLGQTFPNSSDLCKSFVVQKSVKMKFIFDVWFLPLSAAIGLGVIATNLFSFFRATKVKLLQELH